MARRMLGSTLLATAMILAGGAPTASADGLPVPGVVDAGPAGVVAPLGEERYVAVGAGKDTLVARVRVDGGQILRSTVLNGDYTVPAVAIDGSADGLSADGRTLALIRPRRSFPREATGFAVLDGQRLRVRDRVTLKGDFSFDAISPDGSRLYLIEYLSRSDATRYAVRVYDVRRGRLLPDPIEDPDEPASDMGGYPITRAASADGRWAYTLYDGAGGGHPFVHALDTQESRAVCIDVHALEDLNRLYDTRMTLSPDGTELAVVNRGEPVALIDVTTFEASRPLKPTAAGPETDGGTRVPWGIVVPSAVILLLAAATIRLRRRSPRATGLAGAEAGGHGEQPESDLELLGVRGSTTADQNGSSAGPVRR